MKNSVRFAIMAIALGSTIGARVMAQNWNWAVSAGGKELDYANGMVTDQAGNLYVAGSFDGSANFGEKQLASAGYYDAIVAKYDASGKLSWVLQAGGSEGDEAYGLAMDSDGNLYVTGYFSGKADFGNIRLVSQGDRDFFLAKVSNDGKFIWVQQGGGQEGEFGKAVATDKKGNIYVTGIYRATSTFRKTVLKSSGKEDIFLADYSPEGDLKWIKSIGGGGRDEATAIAADNDGDIYLTGWFSGMVDFGKTRLTASGDDDIFIARYNSKGEELWANQAGGMKDIDRSWGIATDNHDNAFITGSFRGSANFSGTSLKCEGLEDYFLAKYDPKGALVWVKQSAAKNAEAGRAVTLDGAGNIYVCGEFDASFAATGKPSAGEADIFVAKFNQLGNVVGINQAGGNGFDRPTSICIDSKNNVCVAGVFSKTCNFGSVQVKSQGNTDLFVAKMKDFVPVK